MTSATAATEILAYEQLSAGIASAAVYQDVPDDAPLPLVIIGDLESVPFAGSDDPDRRITLTLVVLTEGDERAPCTDLQEQIEAILPGRSFTVGEWNLHVSLESSDAALSDDGSGYVGTTILTILAFRED
ncbi:DUF3168 domain-containing protein [Sphingomonas sp. H39-1-10]|uniref:DUF3168 domain-containing protein n=1 Tax=Sphingomonas pollutisoli TaxID=3030829 RepID=UPI0023BA06DE|nr:DUF3168 domain-containing protein [Sphingomonas pollutisoli]MDF0489207.1 DUF3168 domain-containing protein [Sphingomonas pollutisoli]